MKGKRRRRPSESPLDPLGGDISLSLRRAVFNTSESKGSVAQDAPTVPGSALPASGLQQRHVAIE